MPENVVNCVLCGSSQSQLFDQRTFEAQPVENRLCSQCGLVFQSPRMTEAEAQIFYASQYRQLYQGSAEPSPKDLAVQASRADSLLKIVRKNVSNVNRHLDIGCSAGKLIFAFRESYGCQAIGVEPGDAYRNYATRSGFKIFPALQELIDEGEPRFDLVSLAHVLEHLPDPIRYLVDLRQQVLADRGWLLVEVPNLFMHDSFEVAHLFSFSAHSLRQVLQQAGFRPVQIIKHGQPRSRLLPYYLTALCQPILTDKNLPVRKEYGVSFKRSAGMFQRRVIQRLLPSLAWRKVADE